MNSALYEQDFYVWANQNAEWLRENQWSQIDAENIAEELESMGKSQQHALINQLGVLLMHLLKWQYQPQKRSRSWELTLIEQRQEILELLEDSPSLKHDIDAKIAKAYKKALIKAERETGIRYTSFPPVCPYLLEHILDDCFYPEAEIFVV